MAYKVRAPSEMIIRTRPRPVPVALPARGAAAPATPAKAEAVGRALLDGMEEEYRERAEALGDRESDVERRATEVEQREADVEQREAALMSKTAGDDATPDGGKAGKGRGK